MLNPSDRRRRVVQLTAMTKLRLEDDTEEGEEEERKGNQRPALGSR